jgi:hypothetical protein
MSTLTKCQTPPPFWPTWAEITTFPLSAFPPFFLSVHIHNIKKSFSPSEYADRSVGDPDPVPDPHVFGPPGSESISHR